MERKKKKKKVDRPPDQCQISLMKHSITNPFSKLPFVPLMPLPLGMLGYEKT